MKKKLSFILLSGILFLGSCTSGSDSPDPVDPVDKVDVTQEKLKGTWEIYYESKTLNSSNLSIRTIGYDGFKIKFDATDLTEGAYNNYSEYNIEGDRTSQGKYKVKSDKNTVQFEFKSPYTGKDTTTYFIFNALTNDYLKRVDTYTEKLNNVTYIVSDVQAMRNIDGDYTKAWWPTSEEKKATVSQSYLIGTWKIQDLIKKEQNSSGAWVTSSDQSTEQGKQIGRVYTFNQNGTFILIDKDGAKIEGNYYIVDDVVHLLYNGIDPDTKKEGRVKTSYRLKNLNTNNFTFYTYGTINYNNKAILLIETITTLVKQ